MTMNNKINELNIGLMVLSLIVALVIPFNLFLVAYATLGPLHYLTEISWLHDRNYYLPRKTYIIPFYVLGAIYLIAALLYSNTDIGLLAMFLAVVISFYLALCLTVQTKTRKVLYAIIPFIIITFLFNFTITFVTILLVTIVHVYIFTGLFMFYGSLKSRSNMGYLSVIFYISIPVLCWVLPSYMLDITPWTAQTYNDMAGRLTLEISKLFVSDKDYINIDNLSEFETVARFIAFAFTYHYLNWFSKTKIIGWNNITPARRIVIGVIWVGAMGIYYVDYMLGFKVVLTLSFMHVLLEFPLNWLSIKGIKEELIIKNRSSVG